MKSNKQTCNEIKMSESSDGCNGCDGCEGCEECSGWI